MHKLYDTLKWAPTGANSQAGRFVFVKSPEAKERLKPALDEGNVRKAMTAGATVIVAADFEFYEHLNRLYPVASDPRSWFAGNPAAIEFAGTRDATLQGAYLILAARVVESESRAQIAQWLQSLGARALESLVRIHLQREGFASGHRIYDA